MLPLRGNQVRWVRVGAADMVRNGEGRVEGSESLGKGVRLQEAKGELEGAQDGGKGQSLDPEKRGRF